MITIDVDKLLPDERARLDAAMRERPLLADPRPPASSTWWWIGAVTCVALCALSIASGFGRITSAYETAAKPVFAALLDGLLVALAVRCVLGVRAGTGAATKALPWPRGRFLYSWGFVSTEGSHFAFSPATDIRNIDVRSGAPGPSGMSLFTVSIEHGDAIDKIVLFGTERNIPRAAMSSIPRPAEASDAGSEGYRDAPMGRAVLGRDAIERARVEPATETAKPVTSKAARRVSIAAGVVSAAVIWLFVLPMLSMADGADRYPVSTWDALARTFPLPWVTSRARTASDARWLAADRSIDEHIAANHRETLRRLVRWSREHDRRSIRLVVSGPPYAEMQAATRWLAANVPGAPASEVIVGYASPSLLGAVPGDEEWLRAVHDVTRAAADPDLLDIDLARGRPTPADYASITVHPHMRATGVLGSQGSAVIAALAFDFDVDLAIPGSPSVALARGLHVDAPDTLTVTRFRMRGETLPPVGMDREGRPDFAEAVMTYGQQLSEASRTASAAWQAEILAPRR